MTTLLFGVWEMQGSIVILIYILLVLGFLGFIVVLCYKWRKSFLAFLISAGFALLISAFLPLILNEIIFVFTDLDWSSVSPTTITILDSLQGGTLALIARWILMRCFDISRLEAGKQN